MGRRKKIESEEQLLGVNLDVAKYFTEPTESAKAVELYNQYLKDYEIQTVSDKNMLINLVYLEVLNLRFQDLLNKSHSSESKTAPIGLIQTLHENLNQIMALKQKMGIANSRKDETSADALTLLQKKYRIWLTKNQASRSMVCPHCGKMTMLLMRMEHWDTLKHPYFEDRLVYNEKLFNEYRKYKETGQPVVIDEKFIAEVIGTSLDYIEDVIERRKGKAKIDG